MIETLDRLLGLWTVEPDPYMEDPYHKPMMHSAWRGDINMIQLLLGVPDDNLERKQNRLKCAKHIARWEDTDDVVRLLQSEMEKVKIFL